VGVSSFLNREDRESAKGTGVLAGVMRGPREGGWWKLNWFFSIFGPVFFILHFGLKRKRAERLGLSKFSLVLYFRYFQHIFHTFSCIFSKLFKTYKTK